MHEVVRWVLVMLAVLGAVAVFAGTCLFLLAWLPFKLLEWWQGRGMTPGKSRPQARR